MQHQALPSSRRLWASRWIQVSNKASFLARHKVHQEVLLRLLSQVKNRRQPYGKRGRSHVSGGQMLTSHRMGELEPWIDENFVRSVWFGMGYQVNVKMIRDKFSGYAPLRLPRMHFTD